LCSGCGGTSDPEVCPRCLHCLCADCRKGSSAGAKKVHAVSRERTKRRKTQSAGQRAASENAQLRCPGCLRVVLFENVRKISLVAHRICDDIVLNNLSDCLECTICRGLVINNRTCPTCCAIYCVPCLDRWFQHCSDNGKVTCGVCRRPHLVNEFSFDRIAGKLARNLSLRGGDSQVQFGCVSGRLQAKAAQAAEDGEASIDLSERRRLLQLLRHRCLGAIKKPLKIILLAAMLGLSVGLKMAYTAMQRETFDSDELMADLVASGAIEGRTSENDVTFASSRMDKLPSKRMLACVVCERQWKNDTPEAYHGQAMQNLKRFPMLGSETAALAYTSYALTAHCYAQTSGRRAAYILSNSQGKPLPKAELYAMFRDMNSTQNLVEVVLMEVQELYSQSIVAAAHAAAGNSSSTVRDFLYKEQHWHAPFLGMLWEKSWHGEQQLRSIAASSSRLAGEVGL